MVKTIRVQDWTKEQLDSVRDAESHTSHDSTIKALLRDRQLVQEVLSESPNARTIGPSTQQLADGGGAGDLPIPDADETLSLMFGMTGSGKTVTTAYQAHCLLDERDDVNIVAFDHFDSFKRLAETHESETIRIGPRHEMHTVNPLEFHSSEDASDSMAATTRFDEKLRDDSTFFHLLSRSAGQSSELSAILDAATIKAYERAGITHDPMTYDRNSPTPSDVRDVLEDMVEDPDEFTTTAAPSEPNTIKSSAGQALLTTQEFAQGQYDWLAQETSFCLSDTPFTRLDIDIVDSKGVTMHALISTLVQQAARLSTKTIFIMDESHILLNTEAGRDTLLRHVRNSSTVGVGFWVIDQSFNHLTSTDTGKTLINIADRLQLHKLTERPDEVQRLLSLNDEQVRFVQNADTPAHDQGPEILVRDPTRSWYPYRVEISESVLNQINRTPDR